MIKSAKNAGLNTIYLRITNGYGTCVPLPEDNKFKQDEEKEKPKFALRINQLLIYDGKFSYDILDAPKADNKFDPSHIAVEGIDCNISMKKVLSDELDLLVRSIKGYEKSGLSLNKLKANIKADENNIRLDGAKIMLPNSILCSDSVTISFDKKNPKAKLKSAKEVFSFGDFIYSGANKVIPSVYFIASLRKGMIYFFSPSSNGSGSPHRSHTRMQLILLFLRFDNGWSVTKPMPSASIASAKMFLRISSAL